MHVSLKTVLYFCSKEKKASGKKSIEYLLEWINKNMAHSRKHFTKKKGHFLNSEALLDTRKAT